MGSERDVRNAALDTYYTVIQLVQTLPHWMAPVLSYDWAMQGWECRITNLRTGEVLAQCATIGGGNDAGMKMAEAIAGALESLMAREQVVP